MPRRQPQVQDSIEVKLLNSFGGRARQRRVHVGKSRAEVAVELGCSADMVGRYERGENFPPALALVRLGHALHTSLDFLVRGMGPLDLELIDRRLLNLLLAAQELPPPRIKEFLTLAEAFLGLDKGPPPARRTVAP